MHHFFTEPELIADGRVSLAGAEAHHASRVLRIRAGETISVADGSGRVLDAVVTKIGEMVEARVILEHECRPPQPVLVLHQGVAKGEKMDLVIQKSVELGARRIVPFLAERTLVRWDEGKREKARSRWSEIARAAAKQCRSPWLTEIGPVLEGTAGVESEEGTVVVLDEEAERLLREVLPDRAPERMALVVGPEGGLTRGEVLAMQEAGAAAVSLGERILRTETAGPVALALVSYTYGTLG